MDAKDKGGYTAVMLAAVNKHEKVMKFAVIRPINTCSSCAKRGVGSAIQQAPVFQKVDSAIQWIMQLVFILVIRWIGLSIG